MIGQHILLLKKHLYGKFRESYTFSVGKMPAGLFLKEAKIFIWDKAPMAPRYALEIVNRTLQNIMGNGLPFGGKIISLGGDFRQLLPIKIKGTRSETLNLSIKYNELWNHFSKYNISINTHFAKFRNRFYARCIENYYLRPWYEK